MVTMYNGLALVLLLSIALSLWVSLIFTARVLMVSTAILIWNYRQKSVGTDIQPTI